MPGTGHSFTDIALTDGLLLRPDSLRGVVGVDRDAMTVTALAGTPLHELNTALEKLGLSLHNMGDIDEQTIAGAISTGTHGTGGRVASLSAQVAGLEMVTGDGTLLRADAEENPDVLALARLGLGALGILTSVTLRVEPLFTLEAHEAPMRWDEALDRFDELVADNDHFEMYWFPHTDRLLTKRNNRSLDAGRAAVAVPGLAGRRVPLQPGLRLESTAWQPPPRGWSPGSTTSPAARSASAASATSRTRCSPRRAGWSSARWSTPCPARRASRRSARSAP